MFTKKRLLLVRKLSFLAFVGSGILSIFFLFMYGYFLSIVSCLLSLVYYANFLLVGNKLEIIKNRKVLVIKKELKR